MAKNRMLAVKFWDDPFIFALNANDKLLFVYLLTNPLTTIAGAYEISIERIAFDTKLAPKTILAGLARFEAADKVYYKENWILLRNFIKHQAPSKKILAGIRAELARCPKWVNDMVSIPYRYDTANLTQSNSIQSNSNQAKPAAKTAAPAAENGRPDTTLAPIEFKPSPDHYTFAKVAAPLVDVDREAAKFWRHYRSAPAWKALSPRWGVKFEEWLLRAQEFAERDLARGSSKQSKDDKFEAGLADLASDPDFGFSEVEQ